MRVAAAAIHGQFLPGEQRLHAPERRGLSRRADLPGRRRRTSNVRTYRSYTVSPIYASVSAGSMAASQGGSSGQARPISS